MKKCITLLLLGAISYCLHAQNVNQDKLQQTYWNYRDRMLKRFIKIGDEKGESMPAASLVKDWQLGLYSITPNACGDNSHMLSWGADCMATIMWEYIPMLALEYRMLRDEGKDYMPTLNELYFAVGAVNRSDKSAEPYYEIDETPNLNGFFLRDDVNYSLPNGEDISEENEISKNWRNFQDYSLSGLDRIKLVHSTTHNIYNTSNKCNPYLNGYDGDAEMSQDQAIGVLMAMSFIRKLAMHRLYSL